MHDPQCQLLTLVGPSGVGKTRLALQAAAQQTAIFIYGVAFVSLAPVMGREQIVTVIADTLGLVLYGVTDRAEQLLHYLRQKALLLVLDNFEHLLAGASLSLLSTLVAKSLLRRVDVKAGRYDLHELVRQYALGRLRQSDSDYSQTRHRHCRYFTALLARRGTVLKGTERVAVVAELITETATIRLAWHWATTHRQVDALSQAAETLF